MLTLLKEQKTMCKHLMENPYIFQVVDDPIQASHVCLKSPRSIIS